MEFPGITTIQEPNLLFDAFATNPVHTHPLEGLIEFGPYSYKISPIDKIRLGVICPENSLHIVKNLIAEFDRSHQKKERRDYLPDYTGFKNIFRTTIESPNEQTVVTIDTKRILESANSPYITLSQELGNAIRSMALRKQDFDVLCIYLPEQWSAGFEDIETGFDLHDFIKATTAVYNIPTQVLRESKVISYSCRCSVMWRLSIALYVKAGGVPWKLSTLDDESAFIGLSYSTRYNQQTGKHDFTTCCSQVFDADGTGLEFIAYDAGEIEFRIGENPFLSRSEMRKVLSKSLSLYQKRHSGRSPKRLIVHKTTQFTKSEIDGAFDAIPTNIKLELLQIIEHSNIRGIKYVVNSGKKEADGYPVNRGSFFQTGLQEVLLWTQGNVKLHNKNFFKEMKNIPSPLLIRRFAGDSRWNQNCAAIIGLTKMNWNHDGLYDRLPVTLGYAKVLATTIKKMNSMVNKPYEFRYFM